MRADVDIFQMMNILHGDFYSLSITSHVEGWFTAESTCDGNIRHRTFSYPIVLVSFLSNICLSVIKTLELVIMEKCHQHILFKEIKKLCL